MAGLALGFFWIQALLIVAGSFKELGATRRAAKALFGAGVQRGHVVSGDGPGGLIAEHQTIQRGRSKGNGWIHFHDREHQSAVFGGRIKLEDGRELAVEADGEFWPSREDQVNEGGSYDAATFESAYAVARKAKGWMRTVRAGLGPDAEVWVGSGDRPFVSAIDPQPWLRNRALAITGLMALHLAVAAACSTAALWPPIFDNVSKAGAVACLLWFMQAQDFTRIVGEWARPPSRAFLRGKWKSP